MTFTIKNTNETVASLARRIGYRLMGIEENEYSIVKQLDRNNYPRFHIYIKKNEENNEFVFNLHLDQKQPSYEGSGAHAHSGEYEGEIIEREAERIKREIR